MWLPNISRKGLLAAIVVKFALMFLLILYTKPSKNYFKSTSQLWVPDEELELNYDTLSRKKSETSNFILETTLTSSEFEERDTTASGKSTMSPLNASVSPESEFKALLLKQTQLHREILTQHGMTLPSLGVVAKRVIMVTTWRSGSTFTAEVLGAVPGVFYHYEPLIYKGFQDLRFNETLAAQGIHVIASLLNCSYATLHDYLAYFPQDKNLLNRNTYFDEICRLTNRSLCYQPDILSYGCQHFPLQVTKSVRLPLKAFLPLLRNPELNVHVLLLVRDPRGTMASLGRMPWCKGSCFDHKQVCSLLRANYKTALQAAQEFPDNFTVLRYEDLALDPYKFFTWLFKKLQFPMTPSVSEYIRNHTTGNVELPWSTTRLVGSRVDLWKKNLPWEDIEAVQEACGDTLTNYGYAPVRTSALLNYTDGVIPGWKLAISSSNIDATNR